MTMNIIEEEDSPTKNKNDDFENIEDIVEMRKNVEEAVKVVEMAENGKVCVEVA